MKKLQNHLIGLDQGSVVMFSDFENGGKMWTGQGARMRRRKIKFSEVYRTPPMVQATMSMWDMDQDRNQRADLKAEKVTTVGFELVFRTWGDTRVARVRADWTSVGELRYADDWDLY